MPRKTVKKNVARAAPIEKTRIWDSSKDGADALTNDIELQPSKKLRKIKFVNAIGLLNECNDEMHKLDAAIETKTNELKALKEEGEGQADMMEATLQAYRSASVNNERFDSALMAIENEIAAKELEAEGAKSAADELKTMQALAKKKVSQFLTNAAGLADGSVQSISQLMALHDERLQEAIRLKAKLKGIEGQAAAERERESMLGEQVIDLQEKLELNVEKIAGLYGALSFLDTKRKERQGDIAIILKKSGFGEISALVSTLRAQLGEANRTMVENEMAAKANISNRDGLIINLKTNVTDLRTLVTEQKTKFNALFAKATQIIGTRDAVIKDLRAALTSSESGSQMDSLIRELTTLREKQAFANKEPQKAETQGKVLGRLPSRDEELVALRRKLTDMSSNYEHVASKHGRLRAAYERVVAMVGRHILVMDSITSGVFIRGRTKKSLARFNAAFKALVSEMGSDKE